MPPSLRAQRSNPVSQPDLEPASRLLDNASCFNHLRYITNTIFEDARIKLRGVDCLVANYFATLAMTVIIFLALVSAASALEIQSPDFQDGKPIPVDFTCDGANLSPELIWSNAPEKTQSFALIMDDPDAPMGTWVHWVVYDIPTTETGLAAGVGKSETLDNGAKQGTNSFRTIGYGGPCPPPGPPHRYFFKLYALDGMLNLPPGKSKAELEKAMQGHILVYAKLTGTYGRSR